MALNKLKDAILDEFPTVDQDNNTVSGVLLFQFIEKYCEEDRKQYETNKANKALTFGKWKGFTCKELSMTEKGKDYLGWLLSQKWCSEDKFGYIHEECKELNIKKKVTRRAKLE